MPGAGRRRDTAQSDAELTREIRSGDAHRGDGEALAELYRRHRTSVLAYARTCCRDLHTAEDLTSEAFARTLQAVRSGGGPESAWRPYLLTVVRNTAADWASTARRTELSDDFERWYDEHADGAGEQSGEERMVRLEDAGMVVRGFRSLPERWQAALWHTVVEDEPAARVGPLLGISASGVASLTARAREGLREAYLNAHAERAAHSEECRHYSSLLGAAVRRPAQRTNRQLERHLTNCPDCRHAVSELTDLNSRLRAVLPAGLLLWGGGGHVADLLATASATATAGGAGAGGSGAGGAGAAKGKALTAHLGKAAVVAGAGAAAIVAGLLLVPGDDDGPGAAAPAPSATVRAQSQPSQKPKPDPSKDRESSSPTPSATPSSSAPAGPPADDRTRLRLASTGRCMEIPAGDASQGAQPREAACDGTDRQQWDLLLPDRGDRTRMLLRNHATGLCLANSGTEQDGAPVTQRSCDNGVSTQRWLLYAKDGEARFIAAGETMYLGLKDWHEAATQQPHDSLIATSHHYYASPSFGFRFDGALFDG